MENEDDYTTSVCLSFNSYTTNGRTAETAERVRLEFSDESNDEFEFPILDKDGSSLLLPLATVKTQLKELFLHEDQSYSSSSSSSSDEEELDVVSSEKSLKRGRWRKSKSTGASSSTTSWRISDLLKRSYSEGKQSLKFLNSNSRNREEFTKKEKEKVVCAHEKFYLRNKAMKSEDKRRSYLPYKQHVFGFFFTVK
ncbi:hypothetical protein CARUB_v10006707mg [Capsella rubella]|uniref:Uncharacterized protein n=1 Tax=Capsella rubella TaxID=81985 RepID=R0H3V9_9BRAS|nr:hypothetical protein CARUB_v10006707mg [Capsella rubella]